MTATQTLDHAIETSPPDPWLQNGRWDFGWLIGTALIVPIVLGLVWAGVPSLALTIGVTALIGGPHLFSTYALTYFDPSFRRKHGLMLLTISICIPALAIWATIYHFQILLSGFIFFASFHVVHQNAYLTDVYRRRAGFSEAWWSRFVDYGVLMTCFYPVAAYKLVNNDFYLGSTEVLIPSFLRVQATVWLISIAFASFVAIWLAKTWVEYKNGQLNRPKTMLIAITAVLAFLIPTTASGDRLELAFQSINAWHSVQYLGLTWFLLKIRKERGLLESPLLRKISGSGRKQMCLFYGFCLGITVTLLAALGALIYFKPGQLHFEQYWYMSVLSVLLIHYCLDAYFFTVGNKEERGMESMPFLIPSRDR